MFSNYEISLIKRSDSRKYFEDVLQSYYSKNYRAAILLLYSLTIDDLYYKLILMNARKYYNLNQEIKKIEELSKNTLKYSEVEEEIYKIYKEKNILNHDTIDVLEFFKKVRNKCAHPSFFKEQNYNPKEEEVYMIIRRIYCDILIVDAFIKDPYSLIKDDIESKEWGSITDVLIGFQKHEDNYIIFYEYFSNKYFDKFTENNFEKLFHTLIKLIILKKEEWTIINQYKNMLLMESMLNYIKDKGKLEILYNKYEWSDIVEEQLIDDNNKEIYNREWFALTNMYKILQEVPKFVDEIIKQNYVIYQYIKDSILKNEEYVVKYWNIFYDDFNQVIEQMDNKDVQFYNDIILHLKYLTKEQKIYILEKMFKEIPQFSGFNDADIACRALINEMKENSLEENEIDGILQIMNENQQIYTNARSNSKMQINKLKDLGINLDKYDNLKKLLGD